MDNENWQGHLEGLIQALSERDAAEAIYDLAMLTYLEGRDRIADSVGLPKRSFARRISVGGKPDFQLIMDTLAAMGLRLTVVADKASISPGAEVSSKSCHFTSKRYLESERDRFSPSGLWLTIRSTTYSF